MPKMKTRKSAAKRFKMTGTGKFVRNRAGGRHILTKKSRKRKNRLGKSTIVSKTDVKRIIKSCPFGLGGKKKRKKVLDERALISLAKKAAATTV